MVWKYSPTEIDYKLSEGDSTRTIGVGMLKGFGVDGKVDYVNELVDLEYSSDLVESLSYKQDSNWEKKELLLRVLVNGKATLYEYRTSRFSRYFFAVKNDSVKPLKFRRYLIENSMIVEDKGYIGQLYYYVKCNSDGAFVGQSNVGYNRKELLRYFLNYNKCSGDTSLISVKPLTPDGELSIRLSAGINYSTFCFNDPLSSDGKRDFGRNLHYSAGFEAEYLFPNWGKCLAFVFEPSFTKFSKTEKNKRYPATIDYKLLDFPLGIRYYIFIKKQRNFFVTLLYNSNFSCSFDSKVKILYGSDADIHQGGNMILGLGYVFRNFSAELRFHGDRSFTNNYIILESKHETISLVFRYRLVKTSL